MSVYRRRWGAEFALQGARMRIARAYLGINLVTGQAEPAARPARRRVRPRRCGGLRGRLCAIPSWRPAGSPRAAAEPLRPPARRAHDFGRSPSARTDGTKLVSRCLCVGGVPCECVVGRGRREMCVCARPAPPRLPNTSSGQSNSHPYRKSRSNVRCDPLAPQRRSASTLAILHPPNTSPRRIPQGSHEELYEGRSMIINL